MPKAHTENGHAPSKVLDDLERERCLFRPMWARRENDMGWLVVFYVCSRCFVTPDDMAHRADRADLLSQVPRERIDVVEEEDFHNMSVLEDGVVMQGR